MVTIEPDGSIDDYGERVRAAATATIEAMASGADVIYQATFFDGTWRGHADFLLRRDDPDRPSAWGPYHYEVADTKLARHVKASAVLQICSYVDQLEAIQGVRPEWLYVALGGSARTVERLRVDDYMAYYRSVRDRFMATMADETPAAYPPADDLSRTRRALRRLPLGGRVRPAPPRRRPPQPCRRDHGPSASGAAGARRRDARGARRCATADGPAPRGHERAGATSASASRRASSSRGAGPNDRPLRAVAPRGRAAEPEPERGLASLPPPSPGDLFFDIEGDPYALDDGLDYLFGVLEVDGTFHAFWSRDEDGEFTLEAERQRLRAPDGLLRRASRRRPGPPHLPLRAVRADRPQAADGPLRDARGRGRRHAPQGRPRRPPSRRAPGPARIGRELFDQADGAVLRLRADRSTCATQAAASSRSSSGSSSARASARPPTTSSGSSGTTRTTSSATIRLRDWLETPQGRAGQALVGADVPRPGPRDVEAIAELSEAQQRIQVLVDRLADPDTIPVDPVDRSPEQQATWLLAQLLGWHRREEKAMWWEFHRLMDLTPDQLVDEDGAIGLLEPVEMLVETKRGAADLAVPLPGPGDRHQGRDVVRPRSEGRRSRTPSPARGRSATVVALDPVGQTIDIKLRAGAGHPRVRRAARAIPDRRASGAARRARANGSRRAASTAPGRTARPATCCSGDARGSGRRTERRSSGTASRRSTPRVASPSRSTGPCSRSRDRLDRARPTTGPG